MLFACLGMFTVMAQAQKSCSKTCAKKCAKTAAVKADAQENVKTVANIGGVDDIVVAKAAEMAGNIERRQCAKSGAVSYFQKNTCAKSGKVSFAEVNYDEATAKFVNVSPEAAGMGAGAVSTAKEGAKTGKACAKSGSKACCAKKGASAAKATKVSNTSMN